jgi:hypothetical protein
MKPAAPVTRIFCGGAGEDVSGMVGIGDEYSDTLAEGSKA